MCAYLTLGLVNALLIFNVMRLMRQRSNSEDTYQRQPLDAPSGNELTVIVGDSFKRLNPEAK